MESARFAASMGTGECTMCRVHPPAFARAVAFGSYDDEMREMLHALKFNGMRRVAEHVLGRWVAEAVLQLQADAADHLIVVPVPLFRERERQRGFNQAGLLAQSGLQRLKELRPAWKFELRPEALLWVRNTRALYELRPDQRRRSLESAFRIGDAALVRDREVLLVDDIFTTGATANACARVLLRAGAAKVWVVTVARAQPESVRAVAENVARWDVVQPQIPAG
ncbi:MAG: ComF family protein [Janthinobacterium lividum]